MPPKSQSWLLVFLVSLPLVVAITPSSADERPRLPEQLPTDDPYLPTTEFLPPWADPDPIHRLDTVRTTWWGDLPAELTEQIIGESPGQRVIYRDTLTGAEVWLICRSPGDEFEGFYSTLGNFNANGSKLEIDRFLMSVHGANQRVMNRLLSRELDSSSLRDFHWDATDPDVGLCQRFSGAIYRYNVKTGEENLFFDPGKKFPGDCMLLVTDDGKYMFIARQKNNADPFLYLADESGATIRRLELKSISKDPSKDHMGGLHVYRDQDGSYLFSYSLNKSAARTSNPHQQWMATLDGSVYINWAELEGSLHEGYLIGGKRRFLIPAAVDPMTSSLGHAGRSPSGQWTIDSDGVFMTLTNPETREMRYLSCVPSADHFDWSAKVDGFLHRTRRQVGLPIYRVDVPSGVAHRIVATNTSDHLSCFSYSHPSPDGTKCLYRSSMLGNLDMYLAIIRYPAPPRDVSARPESGGVKLTWQKPDPAREIQGYRVYRGDRSGGPYAPISKGLVTAESFVDSGAPARSYYVLTSIEHSGIESRIFSPEVAARWDEGPVSRFIEAETGELGFPMREVFVPPGASAAYAITRAVRDPLWQPSTGKATARWRVELPGDGAYVLWARVRTHPDRKNVGISFAIDGTSLGEHNVNAADWTWLRLSDTTPLQAGAHQLSCSMGGPGCELDKLLLTSDPGNSPKAKGNLPSQPLEAPGSLQVGWDKTGEHVVLRWDHTRGPLLHHFDVYKSSSPDFEPSQGTLLGSPTRNAFLDPNPPGEGDLFYRICAVDTWGNRSGASAAAKIVRTPPAESQRALIDLERTHLRGNLEISNDPKTAGGRCVVLDTPSKNNRIEVPLDVPPGRYLMWVRAKSKGRYQIARLQVEAAGKSEKCLVTGVGDKLFSDFTWSWRLVQSLDSSTVPRRTPKWITVADDHPRLTLRLIDGYVELDQVYLSTNAHDLPAPEAARFKPVDEYRFQRHP